MIRQVKSYCLVDSQGQSTVQQFMLEGPSTNSHHTPPETRSLLTLVNKANVCVSVCVCAYPLFSFSLSQHHPIQNISHDLRFRE